MSPRCQILRLRSEAFSDHSGHGHWFDHEPPHGAEHAGDRPQGCSSRGKRVRPELGDGFFPQPFENCPEGRRHKYVPPLIADVDDYDRGASELHVCDVLVDGDVCAVFEAPVGEVKAGKLCWNDLPASPHDYLRSRRAKSPGDHRQIPVAVFVGESVEEVERMHIWRLGD